MDIERYLEGLEVKDKRNKKTNQDGKWDDKRREQLYLFYGDDTRGIQGAA
jgi:hypothetical protein